MHHFGTQPFSTHFGTQNDTYHQNNANHTDMRFTDGRNTLEAWRVPKREQDPKKKPPMRNIVVKTMLPSATPATQHEGRCPKVQRLPRNMKVDVKKCHPCPDHLSFMFQWGGVGGVGWGFNNVHVLVHTQAQQPHHLSCCPADKGTALS